MKVLSLRIIRKRSRRAVVMPRLGIAHSEPSKFYLYRFSYFSFALFVVLAWLLSCVPAPSAADQTIYSASSQSNSLNNGNEAARSAAMGSAFTAVADDASALFSNPAGLGYLNQGQLFLNSDLWLVGTFQETALGGIPAGSLGGFALAAQYLDYGSMEGRDSLGSTTANYGADRLGLAAGWGMEILKNLSVGAGLNGSQETLAGASYASFSSNLGILWKGPRGFRLGASYTNTGWVSPGGASEAAVNLGAAYEWSLDAANRILTAVGGSLEPGAVNYLRAGLEYSLRDQVFLRAGCQAPLSDPTLGGLTDLTAGIGFHFSGFSLDYAFLPYGDLGAAHRVSVGYFFDNPVAGNYQTGKKVFPNIAKSNTANAQGNGAGSFLSGGPNQPNNPVFQGNAGASPASTTNSITRGGMNGTSAASGLPPLPPAPPGPSRPRAAGSAETGPSAGVSQPQTADASGAKDSLVVQFDLPDNPTPSATELENQGNFQQAVTAYVAALKQNPQDAGSWLALGKLYRELHQKTYAVQCFEQYLKLQPADQKFADWLIQYKASGQ